MSANIINSNTDNININYIKPNNGNLFKQMEKCGFICDQSIQNYNPIYSKFFLLTPNNYNAINLNTPFHLKNIITDNANPTENTILTSDSISQCVIQSSTTSQNVSTSLYIKNAPLIDVFKYISGKYSHISDEKLLRLPTLETNIDAFSKIDNYNNSAYVDGFFTYLSSELLKKNILHGINFYGMYTAMRHNFQSQLDYEDIEILHDTEYFIANNKVKFTVDDYEHLFTKECVMLNPISIDNNILGTGLLVIDEDLTDSNLTESKGLNESKGLKRDAFNLEHENIQEPPMENVTNIWDITSSTNITLQTPKSSGSQCSSRSSYTTVESGNEDDDEDEDEDEDDENDDEDEGNDEDETCTDNTDNESEEEFLDVTIPKFPVQLICMEKCEDTFENLILENDLDGDEWFSALMQIIMSLIIYQKVFNFVHNDLHTANIMYMKTADKFFYYKFNGQLYKVETFGRLFKIIDFGRAIYKYKGIEFCSDHFSHGEEAFGQYNFGPTRNLTKPIVNPNFSFDLCRLGCCIYEYIDDEDFSLDDPFINLINDWCLDDAGVHVLYKSNGKIRYPFFKLYQMIAKRVHNHTPIAQLERPMFKKYMMSAKSVKKMLKNNIKCTIMDIDALSKLT